MLLSSFPKTKTKEGDTMIHPARFGFAAATLTLCLGASNADAFYANPVLSAVESAAVPAAMCGRTCRNGGRYFRGPPEVCAENGLEYCGSSRGGGPGPSVGVVVPGTGIGIGVGPGYAPRESNCRTITVQRDDGSVRRTRRCD
jgi:hypothetical protein